ncbi:phiSA1p31-related protein [Streptomyces malaysiensis]
MELLDSEGETMAEFKVGDKVRNAVFGVGTVVYGPYTSASHTDVYLAEYAGGTHRAVMGKHLTLIPKVDPTDPRREVVAKALFNDVRATDAIDWEELSGPGKDRHRHSADAILAALDAMETPEEPLAAGDKIRILAEGHQGAKVYVGDVLTVKSVHGTWFRTNAPRMGTPGCVWSFEMQSEGTGWERTTGDTETIDGVSYDLNARYKDNAGDVWARQADGLWMVDQWEDGSPATDNISYRDMSLERVVTTYGPLTRV